MPFLINLLSAISTVISDTVYCTTDIGRDNGFGNGIVWATSLDSGIKIATQHQKPIMVIIHKTWCHACKKLKPKFATSDEIRDLSKHFVMINLENEEEPNSKKYAPDGTYIPRILFISPNGSIDNEIVNEDGNSEHKYFYSNPRQIVKSMRKALLKYRGETFDV